MEWDDFSADDHTIRFNQTRHDDPNEMTGDNVIKDLRSKGYNIGTKSLLFSVMYVNRRVPWYIK